MVIFSLTPVEAQELCRQTPSCACRRWSDCPVASFLWVVVSSWLPPVLHSHLCGCLQEGWGAVWSGSTNWQSRLWLCPGSFLPLGLRGHEKSLKEYESQRCLNYCYKKNPTELQYTCEDLDFSHSKLRWQKLKAVAGFCTHWGGLKLSFGKTFWILCTTWLLGMDSAWDFF